MEIRIKGSVMELRWHAGVGLVLVELLLAGCNRSEVRDAAQADGPATAYLLKEEPPGRRRAGHPGGPGRPRHGGCSGRRGPGRSRRRRRGVHLGPDRAAFTVQDLSAAEHANPTRRFNTMPRLVRSAEPRRRSSWRAPLWCRSLTRKVRCPPWTLGSCWGWKKARPSWCAAKPKSTACLPGRSCRRSLCAAPAPKAAS